MLKFLRFRFSEISGVLANSLAQIKKEIINFIINKVNLIFTF